MCTHMPCHAVPWHATPRHTMRCHAMPRDGTAWHGTAWHGQAFEAAESLKVNARVEAGNALKKCEGSKVRVEAGNALKKCEGSKARVGVRVGPRVDAVEFKATAIFVAIAKRVAAEVLS